MKSLFYQGRPYQNIVILGGPEGYPPKMEAWHIRYGDVEFFNEFTSPDEMNVT